jgi:hypothetical protein
MFQDTSLAKATCTPLIATPSAGSTATGVFYRQPQTLNAGTSYGNDLSVENNYGLGAEFRSTAQLNTTVIQQQSAPSWWWLIAILAVGAWVLK